MRRPSVNRREFVAGLCTAAAAACGAYARADAGSGPRFLAARRHGARHEAVLIDARGHDIAVLGLPDRGHSFAIDAVRSRAVIFGRQPGFHATALSLPACTSLGSLALPEGRHFFGHGVFASDGSRVFATENDFEAGRGVIGVYDARPGASWRRIAEFDTAGIGPHEVVLLGDGRTLCVANGGLLTHPDFGKTPLNVSTMRPSLVYLDAADGRLLEQVELAPSLHQLSIRHLAVAGDDTVWLACQHEGPASERPALLGRHRRGGAIEMYAGTDDVQHALANYVGSIALDAESGVIATTSPVGGHTAFWDLQGQSLGCVERVDGCGVAAHSGGRFIISDGLGGIVSAMPGAGQQSLVPAAADVSWDNHLRRA